MKIFLRIMLALYALCITVVSALAMVSVFRHDLIGAAYYYLNDIVFTNKYFSFRMFIISLIFFLASLTFLLSGLRSDKEKRAVTKHTDIGEVKISLTSLQSLVLGVSGRINGVKDSKVLIKRLSDDSTSIVIRTVVFPEINIPNLCEEMQGRVKRTVEESSGVKVNDVKVYVENIYDGYKSRVE